MIPELLVLLSCTQGAGCVDATHAYYLSHPEIKHIVKRHEAKAKRLVGPELVVFSPFLLALAKGSGTFGLNKYFSVKLSTKNANMLIFSVSF